MMTWDDVSAILFDGTEEQIKNVRCPDCGGELKLSFFPKTRNTEIFCQKCGILIRGHGASHTPNFALAKAAIAASKA